MSDATVQMRSLVRAETMVGGLKPRQVFWCNEAQAQHFIQHRIAELIAPPAGPKETPMIEVAETKKSFVEESAGRLTDSQPSTEHGKGQPQSVLQPARALTETTTSKRSMLSLPKRR